MEPAQDPVPVIFDGMCRINHRLQAAVCRPEVPFLQERFCKGWRLVVEVLKGEFHLIGTRCFQVLPLQIEVFKNRLLFQSQMVWIFQPDIATVFQFWTPLLFFSTDLIHALIDEFHNMKAVKGDCGIPKRLFKARNEGRGHIAAGFPGCVQAYPHAP